MRSISKGRTVIEAVLNEREVMILCLWDSDCEDCEDSFDSEEDRTQAPEAVDGTMVQPRA